jgi:hypothetical protein
MRQRVATMIAVAALLIVGAAPALAAPGDVPGRPDNPGENRGVSAEHIDMRGVEGGVEVDSELGTPPDEAKAYGYRIIDEFRVPYGHLLQCDQEIGTYGDGDCRSRREGLRFPDGEPGVMAFWTFWTENRPVFAL